MTPKELMEKYKSGGSDYNTIYGNVQVCRPLHAYQTSNCVVAYVEHSFGITFLIKTARKYYTYLALKNDIEFGGYDYKVTKISSCKIYQLKDLIVLEKEAYEKYLQQSALKEL